MPATAAGPGSDVKLTCNFLMSCLGAGGWRSHPRRESQHEPGYRAACKALIGALHALRNHYRPGDSRSSSEARCARQPATRRKLAARSPACPAAGRIQEDIVTGKKLKVR